MFCPKCGEIVRDMALKCPACGASLRGGGTKINKDCDHKHTLPRTKPNRGCGHTHAQPDTAEYSSSWKKTSAFDQPQKTAHQSGSRKTAGFQTTVTGEELLELIRQFFVNYKNFNGRINKRDYWITMLLAFFLLLILPVFAGPLSFIVSLLLLVPVLSLTTRRLHDVGKDKNFLIYIILPPLIGIVTILLPALLQDSAPTNQWGPGPNQNNYAGVN